MVELGARLRRLPRASIPTVDAPAFAPVAGRTRTALAVLAVLGLAAAAALVPVSHRDSGAPAALAGGKGLMIVIDVSSSTLGFSSTIARSLVALSNDPSQRAGLVLASQSAYVALPPETPGSALRGWARMISYINEQNHKLVVRAKLDRTPVPSPAPGDYPWVGVFTGGTRLSVGLARALQALQAAGIHDGQIVLVSDLRDAPDDLPRVGSADRADADERDPAERRHRRPRGHHSEGVLGLRRLGLHQERRRRGVRTGPRCGRPDAALRAAARPARLALAILLALIEPLLPLRWRLARRAR